MNFAGIAFCIAAVIFSAIASVHTYFDDKYNESLTEREGDAE